MLWSWYQTGGIGTQVTESAAEATSSEAKAFDTGSATRTAMDRDAILASGLMCLVRRRRPIPRDLFAATHGPTRHAMRRDTIAGTSAGGAMRTTDLATFVAVAREGSMTAAAATVGVAQSTVTRQVRALEAELGTSLLVRNGGRAVPTLAGRRLLAAAPAILNAVAAAERATTLRR
jgi:molybdenum-dependent DNA-binding transcriptional regulator ModE